MKNKFTHLFLFFSLMLSLNINAQLASGSIAPNFTMTDLNGTSWDLYTVLGQGKMVILDVSATW